MYSGATIVVAQLAMHAGCGEEAMSAAEMEAHVAVKGDEEAFHHQRAQAHQHAAQAAKKSKERRSAVFKSKRHGEFAVHFGKRAAGVRHAPAGAEEEEDDVMTQVAATSSVASAASAAEVEEQEEPTEPAEAAGGGGVITMARFEFNDERDRQLLDMAWELGSLSRRGKKHTPTWQQVSVVRGGKTVKEAYDPLKHKGLKPQKLQKGTPRDYNWGDIAFRISGRKGNTAACRARYSKLYQRSVHEYEAFGRSKTKGKPPSILLKTADVLKITSNKGGVTVKQNCTPSPTMTFLRP